MRLSRLEKFRKKRLFILVSKCVAIFYMGFFTLSYLTSGTGAYFVASTEGNIHLLAGEWWDSSELIFTKPNNGTEVNNKTCTPIDISAEIQNIGSDMIGPTTYEVYFSENKEPKNHGEKIAEGEIAPLSKGEKLTLTYNAAGPGDYRFKVLQRPGFNNDYETREEIWSHKIKVKCNGNQTTNDETTVETNDTEEEKPQVDETNENNQQTNPSTNEQTTEDKNEEPTDSTPNEESTETTPPEEENNTDEENTTETTEPATQNVEEDEKTEVETKDGETNGVESE
ncbi:amyloid fiber anchoring/assembly protein TapA [Salirhabdus sp. Marseille-P4669]|uniref:amyloid fiber anchoring/assembly protein TapA n=1 Tax=Salirhabdus sp. Marseille-P4669 TaxID=2042310 RepID=UPI000C7D0A22|nr:amyloid fiber anchoring/assembly protein TapA [Salirhabdus sp. Marseille-P4669]